MWFLFILLLFPFNIAATTISPEKYVDMQLETINYTAPRANKYIAKQFNFIGSSLIISSIFMKNRNAKIA